MSRWINTHDAVVPLLANLCNVPLAEGMRAVMEFEDQRPRAGMLYDQYNGYAVSVHMWIDEGFSPSKTWWWAVHDYPVEQLGCKKIFATIPSFNTDALNIAKRVGFREIHITKDYFGPGEDLHTFERLPSEGFRWERLKPKILLDKAA